MTDYLEEHLGNAEVLLERIRQLEQSASGLSGRAVQTENAEKSDDFAEKAGDTEEKSENVSKAEEKVYNMAEEVNQIKEIVDNLNIDLGICGKEQDIAVNRQVITDDNEKIWSGPKRPPGRRRRGRRPTRNGRKTAPRCPISWGSWTGRCPL